MGNKYVPFVSDKDFLECVEWVCHGYPPKGKKTDMDFLKRNMIDPFKLVFDMANSGSDLETWTKAEEIRQRDKTINNRIGEFHQKLLGKVDGWVDLGVGDESKVDLQNEDHTIFIELKNKYNTMNSDALASCRRKLEKAVSTHPKSTGYWAFIISKNGTSGEKTWNYGGKKSPSIKCAWGSRVYEIVTGDSLALKKTWEALPSAVSAVTKTGIEFSAADRQNILGLFEAAFRL